MLKINWKSIPDELYLNENEVHIFYTQINSAKENVPVLKTFLSGEEKRKVSGYIFEKDRITRIISRGVLRSILSRYLTIKPEDIVILSDEYGKPFLDKKINRQEIRFNLSHSGDFIIYAVTSGKNIGIDVEEITETGSIEDIIEHDFSNHEKTLFGSMPAELKTRAFFSCWTRKEAYIKALGSGLSYPLKKFSVSIDPDEKAVLLYDENEKASNWSLREICITREYAAAVAVEGNEINYDFFRWTF